MQTTTNLNLKKPEYTDFADIQDINDNMDIIDEQLAEALLLDFPRKILCSEDCPGLCPKCGKSLKGGDCGCPKKEIDPRLAVLAQLLNKEDK